MTAALKSQIITDLDATPVVKHRPTDANGVVRASGAPITTGTADAAGSTYRAVRVPSRARVTSVQVSTDGGSTNGTADVGLYQTAANGGAVVDADFFTAASAIKNPAVNLECVGGNILTPDNRGKRLWEALALSADPGIDYDVTLTVVEDISVAANKMFVEVKFVVDE